MDYELRPATFEDYPYCYRLTKRNVYELFCRHWGGWVPAEFRKGFVIENISMVIIAGRRAGYLNVIKEPLPVYVANFQLSPAWQNRGNWHKAVESPACHSFKRQYSTYDF